MQTKFRMMILPTWLPGSWHLRTQKSPIIAFFFVRYTAHYSWKNLLHENVFISFMNRLIKRTRISFFRVSVVLSGPSPLCNNLLHVCQKKSVIVHFTNCLNCIVKDSLKNHHAAHVVKHLYHVEQMCRNPFVNMKLRNACYRFSLCG